MTPAGTAAPGALDALTVSAPGRTVWVRVGTLLDGTSTVPRKSVHLVYDHELIRYVGSEPPDAGRLGGARRAPDALLDDVTVLPALIEAHAHLFLDGAPIDRTVRDDALKLPAETMLARARVRLVRLAAMGIQAVRDAGDKHGVGLAVQAEREGAPDRAWVDSPGPAIFHQGRYGSFMGRTIEEVGTPEEVVAARCAAGASRIKLLATGIINFEAGAVTAPPQMDTAEIAAFVAAATARGRSVFAHASGAPGVGNAIAGGVATVEHGFFVTPDQLAMMRDRGTVWVPTFSPVRVQRDRAREMGWSDAVRDGLSRILDGHAASLRAAVALGVRIVAGSDAGSCGVPHGLGLLADMRCMEEAGMPALAVVNAATGVSAQALRFAGAPLGRVEAGCRARLILTRHSPLAGVANLGRDRIVVWDGRATAHPGNESEAGL